MELLGKGNGPLWVDWVMERRGGFLWWQGAIGKKERGRAVVGGLGDEEGRFAMGVGDVLSLRGLAN